MLTNQGKFNYVSVQKMHKKDFIKECTLTRYSAILTPYQTVEC